jgi:hypothetical protein
MILSFRLKALLVLSAALAMSGAQSSIAQQEHSISVGVNYTYVRTNLTPDCNCFGLNGGGAEVQFSLSRRLALLGGVTATHSGDITANHYDLTQVTYAGGLRYFPHSVRRVHPFGDVLVGGAHSSGSLSPDATGHGGANAFSFETGGGLGISLGRRWTLVPARASYMLTTFSNARDDHQNDLRLSGGIRIRLGSH